MIVFVSWSNHTLFIKVFEFQLPLEGKSKYDPCRFVYVAGYFKRVLVNKNTFGDNQMYLNTKLQSILVN